MAYFDPYQVQAMVGFGQPQGALSPEEEMDALGLTPGANLAPVPQTGPLTPPPAAPAGPQLPPQFQADPRLQGLAAITEAFNSLGGGGGNAFTTALAYEKQAHDLQNERMRALAAAQQDNPFLEYETAKQRGYFNLKEGETEDQGFLRYTRERFAPKSESVYSQKVSGLVASGLDAGLANQLANGLVEVKEGPGGIQQIINKGTQEVVGTMTPEQAGLVEGIVGRGKAFGETIQGKVDERIAELDSLQDAQYEMEDLTQFSEEWLDRLSAKNDDGSFAFQTGPLQGLQVALGLGNQALGELSADDIFQRLQSLQIVNLAPVTQQEMKAMGELFATPNQLNEANIGKIKSFLRKIKREQKGIERRRGRARTWLTENEENMNPFDIDYLNGNYGEWRTKQVDY